MGCGGALLAAMAETSSPTVCVLLATHDSSAWLEGQLQSVFDQEAVTVSLVVSDDCSRDATPAVLKSWSLGKRMKVLPPAVEPFGNAHRNFMRLIVDAPIDDAEYVALCDHDDVWLKDKLARAITCLKETGAAGYSSNVTAFWSDGRERLIDKAQPQRKWDHLFSSPGPGCTFVLPSQVFLQLRSWLAAQIDSVRNFSVHDWLIYAYVRERGLSWHIDALPGMRYRQHAYNEIGANVGWQAARRRVQYVRSGAYRRDVLMLAGMVGHDGRVVHALRQLGLLDRFWLIVNVHRFRRHWRDQLALAALFALMPARR